MSAKELCKWNKFSHCRYGRFCHFIHENQKCEEKNCDARQCHLRHPRPCRNILQGKPCPFGDICSFEHILGNRKQKQSEKIERKIEELEKILKSKDNEIHSLMDTIDALNNVISMKDSESEEESEDNLNLEGDNDDEVFPCDECEFITKKKTGLKIHHSKVHVKSRCTKCYRTFSSKEDFNRHQGSSQHIFGAYYRTLSEN